MRKAKLSYQRLRDKMLQKNLTQESLAEQVGISARHVRNLCYKDTNVSISLCYSLSAALETPIESLLAIPETDDKNENRPILRQFYQERNDEP